MESNAMFAPDVRSSTDRLKQFDLVPCYLAHCSFLGGRVNPTVRFFLEDWRYRAMAGVSNVKTFDLTSLVDALIREANEASSPNSRHSSKGEGEIRSSIAALAGTLSYCEWIDTVTLHAAGSVYLRTCLRSMALLARRHTRMRCLVLSNTGSADLFVLGEALAARLGRGLETLVRLDLSFNLMDSRQRGASSLAAALVEMSELRELNLNGCDMTARGSACIFSGLCRSRSHGAQLRCLEMSGNALAQAGMHELTMWLRAMVPSSRLERLNLGAGACSGGLDGLAEALDAGYVPELTHLNIGGCKRVSPAALRYLISWVQTMAKGHVSINVGSGSKIAPETVGKVLNAALSGSPINGSESERTVGLSASRTNGMMWESTCLPKILAEGGSKLVTLELDDNQLGVDGLVSLGRVIKPCVALKLLSLSRNIKLSDSAESREGAAIAMRDIVLSLPSLRVLRLCGSPSQRMGLGTAIGRFFECLSWPRVVLQAIDVRGNGFGDVEMGLLSDHISRNSSVSVLRLNGNMLGMLGLRHLLSALEVNSTLCMWDNPYIDLEREKAEAWQSAIPTVVYAVSKRLHRNFVQQVARGDEFVINAVHQHHIGMVFRGDIDVGAPSRRPTRHAPSVADAKRLAHMYRQTLLVQARVVTCGMGSAAHENWNDNEPDEAKAEKKAEKESESTRIAVAALRTATWRKDWSELDAELGMHIEEEGDRMFA